MTNLQVGLIAAATICCAEQGYIWTSDVTEDVKTMAVDLAKWLDNMDAADLLDG